jgi:hypothetical protein
MNTVVIYDQCDAELKFYNVLDRDISHLNGVYVNQSDDNSEKEDELLDLVGAYEAFDYFPMECVDHDTEVIVCGFLP